MQQNNPWAAFDAPLRAMPPGTVIDPRTGQPVAVRKPVVSQQQRPAAPQPQPGTVNPWLDLRGSNGILGTIARVLDAGAQAPTPLDAAAGLVKQSEQPRGDTNNMLNLIFDPMRAVNAAGRSAVNELNNFGDWLTSTPNQLATRAAKATPKSAADSGPFAAGNATQTNTLTGDWVESRITGAVPGITVTSRGRTAEHNKAVGGVSNSFHLYERGAVARDFVPGKSGLSMGQLYNQVRGTLGPEWKVLNEGDHVHVEPSNGAAGGGGMAGGPQGLANPFSAAEPYFQQAMGEVNKAEQAALTPFSTTTDVGQAPAMPDPILAPKTDWTAADAALEKLKPAEITEKEKMRISRDGWLNGIGQALMRIPDGAGLGQVLAMVGGGALMGRAAGNAEVRARMDAFDEKMARYNVALADREVLKASTARQEAQQEAQTLNTFALQKWKTAYDQWVMDSTPTISGNNIIASKVVDGKRIINVTPMEPMVKGAFAMQRAQLLTQMGGAAQQGAGMVAQAQNAYIMAQTAANMQNAQDPSAAIAAGPIMQSVAAVSGGYGPDIVGKDEYDALSKEAGRRAMQSGMAPGTEEYSVSVQNYIANEIARAALMGNKQVQDGLSSYGGMAQATQAARDSMNARRTVRQGPKGATTTTTYGGQ